LEKGNARKVLKRTSRANVNNDQQVIDYTHDILQIIYTIKMGMCTPEGVVSSAV